VIALPVASRRISDQPQTDGTAVPGRKPDATGQKAQEDGLREPCCPATTGAEALTAGCGMNA